MLECCALPRLYCAPMQACPRCGDPNLDAAPRCARCGTELQPRPERLGAATVLGMPTPAVTLGPAQAAATAAMPANPGAIPAPAGAQFKQTLLGITPAASPQPGAPNAFAAAVPAAPPVAGRPNFDAKRTLIGGIEGGAAGATLERVAGTLAPGTMTTGTLPPGNAPAAPAAAAAAAAAGQWVPGARTGTLPPTPPRPNGSISDAPISSQRVLHPGGEAAAVGSTLLGMPAPMPGGVSAAEQRDSLTAAWAAEGGVRPLFEPGQRTLMGVATPGIAPLNPGIPKTPSIPPPPPVEPTPHVRRESGAKRSGARLLLAAAALLLGGLGLFWVLWTPAPPLTARVVPNPHGSEQLEVSCSDCAAGSRVTLGAASEEVKAGTVLLPLDKPLKVGANEVVVALTRSGLGRNENFTLSVPLKFRVSADLSKLAEAEPRLGVRVEAMAGARVEVDKNPVTLTGPATLVALELGNAVQGADAEPRWLERRVEYTITSPDSAADRGDFAFKVPITPLVVHSPGPSFVTESERFMLSGHTQAGGKVSVSGYPLNVAADGSFNQLMNIDAEGETTIAVRADAKDQAPRFVQVKIRRVPSLAAEAARLREGAKTTYADVLAAAQGGVEQFTALSGVVEEARTVDNSTAVLLDVAQGCAARPCLAKVVYPQAFAVEKGTELEALGPTRETMQSPFDNKPIPVIHAAFVVTTKAPPQKDAAKSKLGKLDTRR